MDKLTAIKIKYQDGTYSNQIPIGALASNVDWDSTHSLVDILGSVNISSGSIQAQIDALNTNKITYTQMTNYVDPLVAPISTKISRSDMTDYVDTATGSLQSQITALDQSKINQSQMQTYVGNQLSPISTKLNNLKADDVSYDNTTSGLVSTDVQDALDELSERESLPAEELTQTQYDSLSESQKMADKLFFITDTTYGTLAEDIGYDNAASGLTATNVQDAIDEIDNKFVDDVGDNVTAWLNEHVDPVGSAVIVDDTLTIAGTAADAKKTGDEISLLKEDLSATADAKKTENEISLLKKDLSYVIAPTIDTKKPRAKNRYLSLAGTKAYKNAILNSYGLLEPSAGSENNWVSEYIKIPTDKLDINIVCRGCSLCVAYYDKTYNFVSFYNDDATPNINGNSNTVISVPNNAEYIRFGFWSSIGYSDEKYYNTFRAYNIIDDLDYSEFDELAPSLPWGFTQPDNKPNIVFSMDSVGTAGFVKFNKPVIITPVSGYKCAITFKNTTKSGDVISSWYPDPANGSLFVPADLDVWIGIRPVDTSQEVCLPENICEQVSIKYVYDNIIYPAPQSCSFLNGYIMYGQKILSDRCFTSHFIKTDEDILFHIRNSTAVYTIIIYTGDNVDYTDLQNWSIYYSRREDIIIPSGSWYCFSAGCLNANEVTAKESYEIIPLTKNFFAPMYKSFARSLIANLGNLGRRIAQLESNTVPQYYEEHITQKINTINSRYSSSNDQFIFITDVHLNGYGGNPGHSKSLINRIALNTAITKVINGGDLLNRPNKLIDDPKTKRDVLSIIEQAASYSRPDTGIPQYLIIGNHDSGVDYPDGTRYAGVISVDEYMVYSGFNMIKPLVISDDKSDTQYYFDENGIRYIILNTELRDEIPTNETYTDSWKFISLALASMPNGFHAIIMPHVLMINPDTQAGDFIPELFTLVDAYNSRGTASYGTASANFTNCVGRVAAIICGHSHMDFNLTTTNGVPVIITTTDNGRAELSRSTLTRTIGTVNEQAFDVFSIDKTNRKIYATRIGAGEDREFSY